MRRFWSANMPKALDLSSVPPERARQILARREAKKREYARRKETLLARHKAWREANPDKCQEQARRWRETNPERAAELRRENYERYREEKLARAAKRWQDLSPAVVRSIVAHGYGAVGLTSKDVPDEVLPIFRAQMLIKRELRKQRAAS